MAKAPVKIFVRDFGDEPCQVWTSSPGKKKGAKDIEFINKDALVYTLQKSVNDMHEMFCTEDLKQLDAIMEPVIRMIEQM